MLNISHNYTFSANIEIMYFIFKIHLAITEFCLVLFQKMLCLALHNSYVGDAQLEG